MAQFDNCYLYDGSYIIRQLSSDAQDKKEERLEISYEKKRNKWEDSHTIYKFTEDFKGANGTIKKGSYKQSQLKSKLGVSCKSYTDDDYDEYVDALEDALSGAKYTTREDKEMPDSYWDY